MKIIEKIININSFNIEANVFLYENGEISLTSNFSNIGYFDILSNGILLLDNNQKVINTNSYPNISNNFIWCFGTVSKSFLLLVDESSLDFDTFKYTKSAVYSVSEQKKICSSSVVGDVIFDDYVFAGLGDTEISYYKIEAEPIPVTFSLSNLDNSGQEYKVMEFSGFYKNIMVCTLNSGGILLLDIEKCEVKSFFEEALITRNLFPKSEGSHIYYGLSHDTFIEIDVEQGVIIRKISIEDELKRVANISIELENWSFIGSAIYKDGYFYFYSDDNILGVFDPKSEKVIDNYQFSFERYVQFKAGKENLQVKNGKVYCLDTSNTLHILEGEQQSV